MRVLVVGSGIVGASTAYHLTSAGADVTVVDGAVTGQATAAGAGVVFPQQLAAQPRGWEQLVAPALAHWRTVLDPFGADAGIARTGIVYTDDGSRELYDYVAAVDALAGLPEYESITAAKLLDPAELADLLPVVREGTTGFRYEGARRVDGRLVTDRLLDLAVAAGAQRRHGTVQLTVDGPGSPAAATLDGERLSVESVVVAAGAWSTRLVEPLRVRLPVRPVRGQILHLDLPLADTHDWPIFRRVHSHYLLGFPGGRVVSGALHEPDAGFDYRRTAAGVAQLLDDALTAAPGLADGTLAEVRVGFRPVSTDGLPVLGRLTDHPHVVVATGLGADGLSFGPYAGSVAADLALARDPDLDLAPYAPDRLGS
ncbi:MAG: FAD-dependent oxidoreductase [Streptosporangiales bacterium]|nr:FAD-dependent oxidoreductase [Streptosporangiales bacterium]